MSVSLVLPENADTSSVIEEKTSESMTKVRRPFFFFFKIKKLLW